MSFPRPDRGGFSGIGGPGGYTQTPTPPMGPVNNTPSAIAAQGTDPWGGFAARYAPGLTDPYSDPSFVLLDLLRSMGMSGDIAASTGFQTLADTMTGQNGGADPLSLFIAMNGGRGRAGDITQSDEAYINFLASLFANQGTVGGRDIDFSELLGNLTRAQDPQSVLGALLSSGGAREQARTFEGLMGDAARMGLNPIAAQAMQTLTRRLGTQFVSERSRTNAAQQSPETFAQFFGRNYGR